MADTLTTSALPGSEAESEACSNFVAFRLWAAALGQSIASCDTVESDSVRRLIPIFAGRRDRPPLLLARLLLLADLRPDDRLWLDGGRPGWCGLAEEMTAGWAREPEDATVWIGRHLPARLPPGIRRALVLEGEAPAVSGVRVVSAVAWDQPRESSAD